MQTIYGKSLSKEEFRFDEFMASPNPEHLLHFLLCNKGAAPVLVVRGAVQRDICARIASNFSNVISTKGNKRSDDSFVSVHQVGAHQFGKNGASYLAAVDSCVDQVAGLFEGLSEVEISSCLGEIWIQRALDPLALSFRPAEMDARKSCFCTARSWREMGELALLAHDDLAQLKMAKEDGFEIASVEEVIAYNLCIENGSGGELHVWNIDPSEESKVALGLESTGYPYSEALLRGFDRLTIALQPGDAYFLKANNIHAVAKSSSRRVSVGRFMGLVDETTIAYWT